MSNHEELPAHLSSKNWEEELTFKLWTSKGTRFRAAKRCRVKGRYSQTAIAILTSYLIILSILPYYLKKSPQPISPDVLAFLTTATSIVLLVYSLIESGNNYNLQAYKFDQCANELSRVYDKVRAVSDLNEQEKKINLAQIAHSYEEILRSTENHEPNDYYVFRLYYPHVFTTSWLQRIRCWCRYYFTTVFLYHVLILLPPSIFVYLYTR
ncbi:MAG: SLATT domain-containing protein [Chthoniobacteraceae bacterium]